MFHVSTLLPYAPADKDQQQLQRKRHLGNDVTIVIFKEGDQLFSADSVHSHFNRTPMMALLLQDRRCATLLTHMWCSSDRQTYLLWYKRYRCPTRPTRTTASRWCARTCCRDHSGRCCRRQPSSRRMPRSASSCSLSVRGSQRKSAYTRKRDRSLLTVSVWSTSDQLGARGAWFAWLRGQDGAHT